ncbi:MAG: ATP-binding protein, partial [Mariprofundaceae bacterium]
IKSESDEITHFVGIQQDLSEYEDLESQFHQAQKMEAMGVLVGGIAHDFNNMLAGMTGNLYLAKKKIPENPEVVKMLSSVEQLSFRAADMIQQLLTFARKGQVSMKQLPLVPFIKETLKLLRTSVPENIALHHDICSERLLISGDATQLHQVLMNLINNARDALEGVDDPRIRVKLEPFEPDKKFMKRHPYFKSGIYACLCIEDNGTGIPEEQIKHLYEPFFTTKEEGKGTGLGLAMTFGAVKTHHGYIEVASVVGKGSKFNVYLPLLEVEGMASYTPEDGEEKVAQGHGETILLVDDDVHVLEVGREVLKSLGYRVLEASNGLNAIDLFTENQDEIELIIMDVVMPELGGVKAAERIKEIRPDIKVIYSTGYDKQASLSGKLTSDEASFLSKPYSISNLARVIRERLEKS